MHILLLLLQGLCALMIVSCTVILAAAALKYARASAAERVLIAPAPEGDNIIPFRNTRLQVQGSTLDFQAHYNPSRGGNA